MTTLTLRRQIHLAAALLVLLGVLLSVFILRANLEGAVVARDLEVVNALRVKVRDLRTVGFEYSLERAERPRVQMEAVLRALPPLFDRLGASDVFAATEARALWRNVFDRYHDCVALLSTFSGPVADPVRQERERQMARLFLIRATSLADGVEELSAPLLAKEGEARRLGGIVVVTSVLVLLVLPVLALLLLRRSVLAPLYRLTAAVRQVREGNFAHRVGGGGSGEFGQLAGAFDGMLDHIQEVTVSRDMLEAESAQRRLSEAKYRRLYESLHDAMVTVDLDGRLLEWNGVFRDLCGYSDEALAGLTLEQLIAGRDRGIVDGIVASEVRKRGYSEVFEVELLRRDGQTLPAEVRTFLLRDETGLPVGMWSLVRDVSERKRYEALLAAKEAAEQANRAKSDFVANMSHEIRTPMNAILGLGYLLDQTELAPGQRDYVSKIELSARSLLGIINDILDFSKVEAGKLDLIEEPFDLYEVMKTLATVAASNARDKDIEVLFDIAPGTPLHLVGDRLRLQQILTNLAANAIKFSERGEVVLAVRSDDEDAGVSRFVFEVRDTGIGIDPGRLEAIFHPFTQVDNSSARRYGGTGLGLAICQRLATLMGGAIAVESEPGRGSIFSVTLPLRRQTPPPPVWEMPAGAPRRLKVLLADDNATARRVMTAMVNSFGWTLVAVAGGGEALAAFEEAAAAGEPFDLLLLDWCMPGIGGIDIVRHLSHRTSPAEMPLILVVTAFEQDRVRRESGGNPIIRSVLTKPVTPSLLLDAVAVACGTTASEPTAAAAPKSRPLLGRTLLVVEDNAINQMVARRLLEGAGAAVVLASSGPDALNILSARGSRFDAVLMDIQMPGMDGYETLRLMRERLGLSRLPVLAMTANALPSDRERSLAAGMVDHIGKPFEPERLIAVIVSCLDRAADATGATLPGFDLKTALIRTMGDADLLRDIMGEFARLYAGTAAELRAMAAASDLGGLRRLSHELKAVAGNIGANDLYRAVERLSTAARVGDIAKATAAVDEVAGLLPTALTSAARFAGGTP